MKWTIFTVISMYTNTGATLQPASFVDLAHEKRGVVFSAEINFFELTGDFELVSEPIVFVSMSSIQNWYQT